MAFPRFFSPQFLPRPPAGERVLDVDADIARHFQVLRVGKNDCVTLFDGQGGEWSARVIEIGKRLATVSLLEFDAVERESPLEVTLVQALATGDKMDFIVQKAVELGVFAIQPVATERATIRLDSERALKRTAHWQAVARSACEQCGRNRIPAIGGLLSLDEWLAATGDGVRLMLHPDAGASMVAAASLHPKVALLIGPEGGFSDREVASATQRDVQLVRLGTRVLRTETAGLAAIAALNTLGGDFR